MKNAPEIITEVVETFAISVVIYLVVYFFLAFPDIVIGASMQPTLYTNERLIVERLTPKLKMLKRGDIIIFKPPGNGGIEYVKRVVGLPGEKVEISGCKVYVISELLEREELKEPYLKEGECTKAKYNKEVEIPSNSYFVLGDNRERSDDSRTFGPLELSRIEGKVFLRFWPLDKVKVFD